MKVDLSTQYLGLSLAHPVVVGASPLCDDLDNVRRLESESPHSHNQHPVLFDSRAAAALLCTLPSCLH